MEIRICLIRLLSVVLNCYSDALEHKPDCAYFNVSISSKGVDLKSPLVVSFLVFATVFHLLILSKASPMSVASVRAVSGLR